MASRPGRGPCGGRGAVVSFNPYYVYYRGKINVPHIGTERAYQAAALRTLLDAGVTATLHSDTPVGPPRPLEWAWIAVNRLDFHGESVLAPDERISVDQALRMITINAAYILGVDDRIGSIEPGKFADFAVLEENPYKVKPEDLKNIVVSATVKGGRVFDVKQFKSHPLLEEVTKSLEALEAMENPDTLRTLGNLPDCLELDKP